MLLEKHLCNAVSLFHSVSFLSFSMCFHLPGSNVLASVPTSFSVKPAWILQCQIHLRSLILMQLSAFLWNKVLSHFITTQLLLLLISNFYESVLPDLFHFLQFCDCEYVGRPVILYLNRQEDTHFLFNTIFNLRLLFSTSLTIVKL